MLDHVRRPRPGFRPLSEDLHCSALHVPLDDHVRRRVYVPHVSLRIETDGVGAFEFRRTFSHRADELAIGVEFHQRMVTAIEKEDVTLRTDGDSDDLAHDVCGGVMEKPVHEFHRQLRGVHGVTAPAALCGGRRRVDKRQSQCEQYRQDKISFHHFSLQGRNMRGVYARFRHAASLSGGAHRRGRGIQGGIARVVIRIHE